MIAPVTTLDPRYSEGDAVPTSWDETRRTLESAEVSWISTVRADSRPHVTPCIAVWFDGTVHFVTGANEQKAVNLRNNPHVIVTTGCNQWDKGLDVVVEGDAVRVTDNDVLGRLAERWVTKWDGRFRFLVRNGNFYHSEDEGVAVLVFAVTLTQVLAFTRGEGGSHTTHRF